MLNIILNGQTMQITNEQWPSYQALGATLVTAANSATVTTLPNPALSTPPAAMPAVAKNVPLTASEMDTIHKIIESKTSRSKLVLNPMSIDQVRVLPDLESKKVKIEELFSSEVPFIADANPTNPTLPDVRLSERRTVQVGQSRERLIVSGHLPTITKNGLPVRLVVNVGEHLPSTLPLNFNIMLSKLPGGNSYSAQISL